MTIELENPAGTDMASDNPTTSYLDERRVEIGQMASDLSERIPPDQALSRSYGEAPHPDENLSPEVNADIVRLRHAIIEKDRLQKLQERGRFGVVTEGNARPELGDRLRNSDMSPEEAQLVAHATNKLTEDTREHVRGRNTGGRLGLSEIYKRIAEQPYGTDRLSIVPEWGSESVERIDRRTFEDKDRLKEKIEKFRRSAHEMYQRNPERFSSMSVEDFLHAKTEYDSDLEVDDMHQLISEGLEQAGSALESVDLEKVKTRYDLGVVNDLDRVLLWPLGKTLDYQTIHEGKMTPALTEALSLLGEALLGDTSLQETDDADLPRRGQDTDELHVVRYPESNRKYIESLGGIRNAHALALLRGAFSAGNAWQTLSHLNPDKFPKQLFSEFRERMLSAKDKEAAFKADFDQKSLEKWGPIPASEDAQPVQQ